VIEEFRPLHRALEWRIAELYWQRRGVLPFARNEVPFVINNSGRLSECAAEVLVANCLEAPPEGLLEVVELGAGTGLFARYFLDSFRERCERGNHDFYRRLRMVVTDRSPATVEQWGQRGVFDGHRDHVTTLVADATAGIPAGGPVRAVFCNYLLDVLPAAIVRRGSSGAAEQLCVRTHLVDDDALVRSYTSLALEGIRQVAASSDPAQLERLFPLLSLLDYEVAFRPQDLVPGAEEVLRGVSAGDPVLFNFGALECLSRLADRLEPFGFVLLNDYGPTRSREAIDHASCQRFGATSALGLNFPLVEERLRRQDLTVLAPTGDQGRAIHARLVTRRPLQGTPGAFEQRFGEEGHRQVQAPIDEARSHASAGRVNEALAAYGVAVSRNPRDWTLLAEAADFVANQTRDHAAALELARVAIDLNPFYSASLWNVLGDALYCLERFDEAHEAYLQAERIDPDDGRTNLNLAYTFLRTGDHGSALRVIARGLASDAPGMYRGQLLEKQQQVLPAVAVKAAGEAQRLAKRHERFTPTGLPRREPPPDAPA
jgi:tetratricopeptide (TPR) repeat protein